MSDFRKYYGQLNDDQKRAVDITDGPLLVIAGPGTGKTQLLSVRAANIVGRGKCSPDNILILTYTNAAAKAMKQRLAMIMGRDGYEVETSTFHGFANSIIQRSEEAANYVGDKVQMGEVERVRALEYILDNTRGLEEIRPFRAPYTYLGELARRISDLKKDGITPEALLEYVMDNKDDYAGMEDKYKKRLGALAIVYKAYEEIKSGSMHKAIFDERGRYDFDDMILFATQALGSEAALKAEYALQYRYVMVDEFQDTNGAQLELLFTIMDKANPNICCVGDDDQSIYRFQGANLENFRRLESRFPSLEKVKLTQNYRSTEELVDISKSIAGLIPQGERVADKSLTAVRRFAQKEISFREFTTEAEELLFIVDKIKAFKESAEADKTLPDEERSHPFNSIAVLVRKRADILKVVDSLLQAGIPYATDGKEDIGSEVRVRQLIDVLELAYVKTEDPDAGDIALYKVLSADYFGIPQEDVLKFIDHCTKKRGTAARDHDSLLSEFLGLFCGKGHGLKLKQPSRMRNAAELIKRLLSDARTRSVHTLLTEYIRDAGMFGFLLKEYSENDILRIRQLRAMASFVNMVKASDLANPAIRLDDLMLEMKTRREHDMPVQGNLVTLTQEGVRVYTAHGAKGLEFRSVIIPFCLSKKNWPMQPRAEMIQLPGGLFRGRKDATSRDRAKELAFLDETRLFYVASTRAKSNLVFTASPTESSISSQYMTRLDIDRDAPQQACEEPLLISSLELTDSRDPFIGTEAVLKDMVSNMSLNPTRLNTYIACPRRFLYNDVLKLPGPKKRSLVFGNCVHKALEDTYRKYMATKKFPDFEFLRDAFLKELRFQGVDKNMYSQCSQRVQTVKEWYADVARAPVMPLSLERKLMVTVGDNIIFTGKYDKVEWLDRPVNTVKIVDYKTGKPDDHLKSIDEESDLASEECDGYLRQLVCYKLLYEKDRKESKGRTVGSGELVFIEPVGVDIRSRGYKKGQHATRSVAISGDMVRQVEDLIISVHSKIEALDFARLPKRDGVKCQSCDFDRICWG